MTASDSPRIAVDDLARLIDRSPMGFVAAERSGTIVHVNTTLLTWLGLERDEVVGSRSFQQLLAPGGRIYYETHVRPLLDMHQEVREIAVDLVRSDGTRLPVLINVARQVHPVTGEELIETIAFDATERRRYERELLLERQLAERSESRLRFLFDLTAGLASAITVDEVVEVIRTRGVGSVADAICTVWVFEPGERAAVRVDAAPLTEAERLGRVYFPDGGAALEELRSGELVVIEDCDAQKSAYPLICGWLGTAGRRSALIAPLLADGQLFGVIGYGLEVVHRFDDEELGTVRSFAAQANQALGRALAIEAEHLSRDRLSSLATFSAVLAEAVTLDDVIDGIVESATPLLGAVGVRVAILDETKSTLSVARRGGLLAGELDEAAGIDAATIAGHAVRTREVVIRPDRSELVASFPESSIPEGPEMGRVIAAPLLDDGEPIGAWVLVFAESGPPDDDDVRLVRLFIDRAASAIRRARMYEFERGVAVTLQRSLLADVPTVPGWSIDTWYEPGSEYLEVGGDLYDVTVLGDGRLVVIVGDVVGHGLPAASAMGQLRSAGTALAIVTTNPTAVLCGLDQFARVTPGVMYSSLCCVMLHPDGTGSYACAGHPPPILVRADGSTVVLDGGRSALLGVEVDRHHEAPLVVEEGATLVVFTDGLIERRSVPVALTLNRLRDQLSAMDFTVKGRAEEIGRAMLENDAPADDVVVVRLTRTTTP